MPTPISSYRLDERQAREHAAERHLADLLQRLRDPSTELRQKASLAWRCEKARQDVIRAHDAMEELLKLEESEYALIASRGHPTRQPDSRAHTAGAVSQRHGTHPRIPA